MQAMLNLIQWTKNLVRPTRYLQSLRYLQFQSGAIGKHSTDSRNTTTIPPNNLPNEEPEERNSLKEQLPPSEEPEEWNSLVERLPPNNLPNEEPEEGNSLEEQFESFIDQGTIARNRRRPGLLVKAMHTINRAERRGNTLNHYLFRGFLQTLYRYGYDEEIISWCDYYRQKNVDFIDLSYPINKLLIDCHLHLKQFDKAMAVLKVINARSSKQYCDVYRSVIKALATNGMLFEAVELFKEMFDVFFNHADDREHFVDNQETYRIILQACTPTKDELEKYKADGGIREIREKHAAGMTIFEHFRRSGLTIYNELLPAVREWFLCDPDNRWIIKDAAISSDGVCSNCEEYLEQKTPLDPSDVKKIQNFVLTQFWKKQSKNVPTFVEVMQHFIIFLEKCGPFDIIIDGMNVGLDTSHPLRNQHSLIFDLDQLEKTVNYFSSKGKKVLVLLKMFDFLDNVSHSRLILLLDHCEIFHTQNFNDDILILYALAHCGMSAHIVSRDAFESHATDLPPSLRYKFLQWVRHQTLRYYFYGPLDNMEIDILGEFYNPYIQWTDSFFHVVCTGFRWKCCQKIT